MRICWKYKTTVFCVLAAVLVFVPLRSAFCETSSENKLLIKSLAHHMMGVVADYQDQSADAIREYQKAIEFNPNSYLSRFRLGAHLARLGNLQGAQEHLSQVTELNPDDIQARYILALIYSAQKQFDKAALEYEIILKSLAEESPENINIYFYLGQLYYSQHQYEKAIDQFNKILKLNPHNIEMLNFIGALYVELEQDEKAKVMFKKVLELDSGNDMALNSLGYIYAQQGNHLDEALRLIKRAIEKVPTSAAYQDSLGWIYYKQGRYQEALEILHKANEKLTDSIILDHLGDVYLAIRQYAQAKEYWNKALKIDPGQKRILEKINRIEILQKGLVDQKQFDNQSQGIVKDE